ncbi:hypothetical protein M3P36_05380 [Altererythrobacter sp. KTW20L]|uniref:hypothetical protein n=1 Tax=Altererythrobacter sp. KTW20L TaxID=2942210 RepID=UPI0020BD64FB|nr:hypothetical protein [Altererythrobacter sp. KTW20L]MCL6250475.1 hypothetical protein [Altererythrobacter sp. KTW20L]
MRRWLTFLGGLVLWAAHFVAVYGIASVWPGQALAGWLVLAVTLAALALDLWLARRALAWRARAQDEFDRWLAGLAVMGYALAFVAMLYQAPAAL